MADPMLGALGESHPRVVDEPRRQQVGVDTSRHARRDGTGHQGIRDPGRADPVALTRDGEALGDTRLSELGCRLEVTDPGQLDGPRTAELLDTRWHGPVVAG